MKGLAGQKPAWKKPAWGSVTTSSSAVSRSILQTRSADDARSSIKSTLGSASVAPNDRFSNSSMPMLRVVDARRRNSSVSVFRRTRLLTRVIN